MGRQARSVGHDRTEFKAHLRGPAAGSKIALEASGCYYWMAALGRSVLYRKTMELRPYRDPWPADDPHANFKSEVASYTTTDPLPTLERLSAATGIPVECLIRYVLVKWAASGSEALLAMTPIVFQQMREHVERAELAGSDEARLRAYAALRDIARWLQAGSEKYGSPGA